MSTTKLPEDIEAERSLLATLCAGGTDQEAAELVGYLDPADFAHPGHRAVWEAAVQLLQERTELGPLTLKDMMARLGSLGSIGEYTGIVDLCMAMEVGRPRVLVDILKRHRRRREAIKLGAWLVRHAEEDAEEIGDLIAQAGAHLARIGQSGQKDAGLIHAADISDEVLAKLQDRMDGRSEWGITVAGFSRLNGVTHGFQPGQLIVLGARPGVGKTALALNWSLGIAERHRCDVAFFSLEMSKDEVYQRLLSAKARVDVKAMCATRDMAAMARIGRAKIDLDQMGIHISDRAQITATEISARVDALLAKGNRLGLVVVDYLQLVSSPDQGRNRPNEAQRVGEITRSFKLLAKDRGIPVVVLSQLNREVEGRSGKRPQLSDLRDSGAIEQDADIVGLLHRDIRPDMPNEDADLIFAKHRNGATTTIPLRYRGEITRFEELERQTQSDASVDPWAVQE